MTTTPMNREQRRAAERARKARGLKRISNRNRLADFKRQAKPAVPATKTAVLKAIKVIRQMPAYLMVIKAPILAPPPPPPEEPPAAL